ncbi:MAG: pilus assembly protein TadG-related protein [Heyndrickxia sp.]
MKYLKNERGNSFFYILWLMTIVVIMLVIVLNIAKAFVVKQQADTAVEQAAIAGTREIIVRTNEAIKAFDDSLLSLGEDVTEGKTIEEQVDEKKRYFKNRNYPEAEAYIKALNEVLPSKIDTNETLRQKFIDKLGDKTTMTSLARPAVETIIGDNHGNKYDPEPELDFTNDWRLEVKATATFESISDNKIIAKFLDKIPQKGYGPKLEYLENVFD